MLQQPRGLSIGPYSTLFECSRQWLDVHYAALDDEDQQLRLHRPVENCFPEGPSKGHVDILIITADSV